MSVDKFRDTVLGTIPQGATLYRLVVQNSDELWYYPPEGKKALRLSPFELPAVKTGKYTVVYEDADANKTLPQVPVNVSWTFPGETAAPAVATSIRERTETDGEDLRLSLELEQSAADASTVRARAASLTDTLTLYRGFTAMMGTQSAHELQVKNEQFALLNQACTKLLETQVELMDTFRQHAASLRTPQPPPQWDKIVAAAAPAFAAMYVETVNAIKGEGRKSKRSTADLLTPVDEKLGKLYELLGNVASNDRLEVLLKDPEKLQLWMKSVQTFMSGEPKAEDAAE